LIHLGRFDEAVDSLNQALAVLPDFPDALNNLASALIQLGRYSEAEPVLQRALVLRPRFPEAQTRLIELLRQLGRGDEALGVAKRFLAQQPNDPRPHNLVGILLASHGQLDDACHAFRKAAALQPDFFDAHYNLAGALRRLRRFSEAEAILRALLINHPRMGGIHNSLGIVLAELGSIDESIECFQQALRIEPQAPDGYVNLAGAFNNAGLQAKSFEFLDKALELAPGNSSARSNWLLMSHYRTDKGPLEILAAHRIWDQLHAEPLRGQAGGHPNGRDPNRRLRIGYVSPDFRDHPVGRLMLPIFEHHDGSQVEVIAYAQVSKPDKLTKRLKSKAAAWRNLVGLSDQQVAERVRADRIDILVDLAGHTADHRLLVFARKPAPVQVSYLGYPDTTGLAAIDYRFTDGHADPPGESEHLCVEELVRLDPCAWCTASLPKVEPLASAGGPVTFGSFNASAKVSDEMLRVWARILREVPDSRLLLKALGWSSKIARQRVFAILVAEGIEPGRIELLGQLPFDDHLALHGRLDVALDTYPYHGTNMTFEALWMGTPVISLAGNTHVSRVGVSLLNNLGHPEWIAHGVDDYVAKAIELARNSALRAQLRSSLRAQMLASPLMDGAAMARRMEAAYRQIWLRWCAA
jgi:predicted O-linked N-acetylglucosamine transferase (SPINDLY family)